jgi:hypothetical protein
VALDLKSGQKLWQVDYSRGLVREMPEDEAADQPFQVSDAHSDLTRHVGVARYTLSVQGERLFARMGSPVTLPSDRRLARWLAKDQGFLVGLDLQTQGKPLEGFPIRPESSEWTFEGPPLCDGQLYYVAMRIEGPVRSFSRGTSCKPRLGSRSICGMKTLVRADDCVGERGWPLPRRSAAAISINLRICW